MKHLSRILIVLGFALQAQAQVYNLVYDRSLYTQIEPFLNRKGSMEHTGVKPLRMDVLRNHIDPDTLNGLTKKDTRFQRSWAGRKLLWENLFKIEGSDYNVYIDPLFNFEIGQDRYTGTNTWTNARGAQVYGSLGKQVSFYTAFWENQGVMVNYVDSFVLKMNVVPGQGRVKPFGTNGYDYAYATGYVSYSPSKFFNFQAGNDKQFIGDGYRSLLLSDNAFNYPYGKITTRFWKLQYTNLFMAWQNIGNAANSGVGGYPQKFVSAHHLSIQTTPWLQLGLFESIVWQGGDTLGNRRGFDPNYLNPIIFFRPVEFSRGSPDNVLMGLHFKALLLKKYLFYGQLVLDEFSLKEVKAGNGWWANKQGFQLGWTFFDLFGLRGLQYQNELNVVRPYTYGHFSGEQSYTHYAQPAAHPLGANFVENVQFLRWNYRRWGVEAKFQYALYGADTLKSNGSSSNFGQNIFQGTAEIVGGPTEVPSIYGNKLLQGYRNTVLFTDLNLRYLINPRTGMQVALTASRRMQDNPAIQKNTTWVYLSFRTRLPNRYYDF
jgi:hypothetical protein